MTHPDPEVQKSFAAIRAFAAGNLVPPPPKYFDDAGDDMDMARAAGWVDHALFAPDMEDDSVLRITFYRPDREAVVDAPSHNILSKDGSRVDTDADALRPLQEAVSTCMRVLAETEAGLEYETAKHGGVVRRVLPEAGEAAIRAITVLLENFGGRLDGNADWPRPTDAQVRAAERVMSRLIEAVSDDTLRVRAVSRLDTVQPIVYPVKGGDARSRDAAAYALMTIGTAIEQVGSAYRRQDEYVRQARAAEAKAAAQREEIATLRKAALDAHGTALEADGRVAAAAILAHLREGRPLPVYKSTAKHPNPERDAIIDALNAFLGEDGHAILSGLIGSDLGRNAQATRDLSDRLSVVLADGPAPA